MADLSGFPNFEMQFDKHGNRFDPAEEQQLFDFLSQGSTTDLLVISHGWNNDLADARALYARFFERIREIFNNGSVPGVATRRFAVASVLWPAKKFTEEELIPGGAASAGSPVSEAFLNQRFDDLKNFFDDPAEKQILTQARKLIPQLEHSPQAQRDFMDLVRRLPNRSSISPDDASDRFFTLPGDEVLKRLSKPVMPKPGSSGSSGGAAGIGHAAGPAGGAAGFGAFFSGLKAGALKSLNLLTYYEMKSRAGTVGTTGVNPIVRQIRSQFPALKVHLIGHSFGGRLVTATTLGPDNQPPIEVSSLTLLQSAFSHNGFASKFDGSHDGFFRGIVARHQVKGPTVITFTKNDKAVGLAYPLASLLALQNASALGDANDPFGGIGRNGAQHTTEAVNGTLNPVGSAYHFEAGKLYNLNADAVITGHSDISKNEVAFALLTAIATT